MKDKKMRELKEALTCSPKVRKELMGSGRNPGLNEVYSSDSKAKAGDGISSEPEKLKGKQEDLGKKVETPTKNEKLEGKGEEVKEGKKQAKEKEEGERRENDSNVKNEEFISHTEVPPPTILPSQSDPQAESERASDKYARRSAVKSLLAGETPSPSSPYQKADNGTVLSRGKEKRKRLIANQEGSSESGLKDTPKERKRKKDKDKEGKDTKVGEEAEKEMEAVRETTSLEVDAIVTESLSSSPSMDSPISSQKSHKSHKPSPLRSGNPSDTSASNESPSGSHHKSSRKKHQHTPSSTPSPVTASPKMSDEG
jgi:hypothetical protein